MKYILAVLAVIAAVLADDLYTPEQLTKVKAIAKECEESTHVDHKKITEFRQKHFDDHDQHLKDYMFCIFKKLHWMTEDGHLEKDAINKYITKSTVATEAMNHCEDKHGSTGAETAYLVYKCFMEHLPGDYKYPL